MPMDQALGWRTAISGNRLAQSRFLMAGLFAIALLPLLAAPVLPLIDYYNHLARFFVLAHVASNPLLQQAYEAHWSLMPDIGLDVIATPILRFVPPMLAGHLIAAGILAVLFSGVLYFNHILTGRRSYLVAVLLAPLLYSYVLNWGFANFLLGLGLAFWAAGWWLSKRHRPLLAVPVSCLWAVLIFLTHGIDFALYEILVASLEIGLFIAAPARHPRTLVRSLFLVAIQAVIPVVLFLVWEKSLNRDGSIASQAGISLRMLRDGLFFRPGHTGLHRLGAILRVEEGPAYWFDAITFVLQAAAVCFLIWRRRVTIARAAWPLIAAAILLVGLCPPIMFGVDYVADRMPLFAALVLLGALSSHPAKWTKGIRLAYGILIMAVIARIGVTAIDWHGYTRSDQEFRSVAGKIPPGSLTLGIPIGSGHHEFDVPRCEMFGPLLVTQYGQINPLFATQGQHPLLVTGRLKKAMADLLIDAPVPNEKTRDYNPYIIAAFSAGFDDLLICNAQLLTQPFPRNLAVVARTPQFVLLRAMR